ncbi:MAG: preprotein translocase subunit SecE [Acidobacteria bacterium]|nr:preprotein translocase subunit SecE [Acidobacteriota bacterium]MBI3472612.1 preprotein translocase subunit SecE [Candidatus Solibacter usitatus]
MPESKDEQPKSFLERVQQWPAITREYVDGLRTEMKRVTWPTKKQVQSTTAVVILTVFGFAAYFKVVDEILVRALNGVQKTFTK